jgi:hypothetical protein
VQLQKMVLWVLQGFGDVIREVVLLDVKTDLIPAVRYPLTTIFAHF